MKMRDSLLSLSLSLSLDQSRFSRLTKQQTSYKYKLQKGFTIVELLVVIVVIGILAAITIVSYTGITQRATVATLQSDLDNASKKLKMYYTLYGSYPTALNASNCPTAPTADNNYCLPISGSNTISYNGGASNFSLVETNGTTYYKTTDSSSPVATTSLYYGLSGYWNFDEGSGTATNDISMGGGGGVINGTPTWVAGKYGSALNFLNGAANYTSVPFTFSTTNFTVSFWYKTSATLGNAEGWFGQSGSFAYERQGMNNVEVYAYLNAPNDYASGLRRLRFNVLTQTNTDNNWHHRVLVIYVQSGTAHADEYQDGVYLQTRGVDYTGDSATPSGNLRIGDTVSGGNSFNGSMDDVRIYNNRSLTAAEITALYNAGAP